MIRRAATASIAAAALIALPASPASARKAPVKAPAPVRVGHVALGRTAHGDPSILIPVTYPIQLAGRTTPLELTLRDRAGEPILRRRFRVRLSAGRLRAPERRRRFAFVHRVDLLDRPPLPIGPGTKVTVRVKRRVDLDADGTPEIAGGASATQALPLASDRAVCSTPALSRTRSGRRTTVPLPACTRGVPRRIVRQPEHGHAQIEGGSLVYRSGPRFRGGDLLTLSGGAQVRFAVGAAAEPVVRALGDSVTAGFGYYGDGGSMTIWQLPECRPPATGFDDACSSNSLVTDNEEALEYAPDYGLSNNISWAAQWANEHAIANFENLAISGSEPSDWAPGGEFHKTTERIEREDPDFVLMTIGANPLLSEMLFGIDHMGCAVYAQIFGGYSECVEDAFAGVHLQERLRALYADLVQHTDATIYLMQYHLSVPSIALAYSAAQIAEMGKLLNREIARVAAEVDPQRLQVVAPPHFGVGIDLSPVYPSSYSCSSLGYKVDGPSVQSTPTQDELAVLHPLSFCEGPPVGPPWVISGDTGIHPSAAGYTQMASQVPAP